MATSLANPQASAPDPTQGAGPDQASPLQQTLAKAAMQIRSLGAQNQVIEQDCNDAFSSLIKALQKVSQASSGPAVSPQAPPNQ